MHDHEHSHELHRRGPHKDDVAYVSCMRHSYEDGTTVSVCGIDFCAHKGERTVLLGPNGAGKSTLLEHLLGLLKPQEGHVKVFGLDPSTNWKELAPRIGVVLQDVERQLIMPTVYDDIAFSLRQYGMNEVEVDMRVKTSAALTGVEGLLSRPPQGLSGGEKRRVALAGALAGDPELLVLDEPFEGLDPLHRSRIVELLNRLCKEEGVSIIMSTHDIDSIAETADYCYVLHRGGEIVLSGTPEEVFSEAAIMERSNIRPPILAQLFERLNQNEGISLPIALSVDKAAELLKEQLGKSAT